MSQQVMNQQATEALSRLMLAGGRKTRDVHARRAWMLVLFVRSGLFFANVSVSPASATPADADVVNSVKQRNCQTFESQQVPDQRAKLA